MIAVVIPALPGKAIARNDPRLADPYLIFIENARVDSNGRFGKVANRLTREEFLSRYAY